MALQILNAKGALRAGLSMLAMGAVLPASVPPVMAAEQPTTAERTQHG